MSGHATGVAAIAGRLRDHAADNERDRRLSAATVASLQSIDAFRLFVPSRYGGPETDPVRAIDLISSIAALDASAAWCAAIASQTSHVAGVLEPVVAAALFGRPASIAVGAFAAVGRAVRVDGGFEASGRWAWGSGVELADWVSGGVQIEDGSTRLLLFAASDVAVHDTWDPLGLRGTGSHDFSVRSGLVPDGHVIDFGRMSPTCDAAVSRVPTFVLFSAGIAAVVLGIATGAQEALVALATQKRPVQSSRTLAEYAVAQDGIARNDTALRAARAHLIDATGRVWEVVRSGSRASTEDRLAVRLAATHATEVCVGVVSRCVALAGGSAVPSGSPLARAVRDVHTAAAHVMVSARAFETGGRFRLGFPIDPATF